MITLHRLSEGPTGALPAWASQVDRWALELAHVARQSSFKSGLAELVYLNRRWGEFAELVVKERLLEQALTAVGNSPVTSTNTDLMEI